MGKDQFTASGHFYSIATGWNQKTFALPELYLVIIDR
jgi:hypothetical protein